MIGIGIILWLLVGFIIHIMAGLTYGFEKRFFAAFWLIPMGPLALVVWRLLEKWEERKNNDV
jgi:membrane protein required for beta-lactamase induction